MLERASRTTILLAPSFFSHTDSLRNSACGYCSHTVSASVYALRKESDKTFEWLEHAWATHDAGVTGLLNDPFLRAYKDDPRFIAFGQKIGVMPKTAPKP